MNIFKPWYNVFMKLTKKGTPDKRFKSDQTIELIHENTLEFDGFKEVKKAFDESFKQVDLRKDPNELHEQLLKENNLVLDFDVIEGTISTKHGLLKLDKPTLVIKAKYGEHK